MDEKGGCNTCPYHVNHFFLRLFGRELQFMNAGGGERDPGGAKRVTRRGTARRAPTKFQEGGINPAPKSNRSRWAATQGRPYEDYDHQDSGRTSMFRSLILRCRWERSTLRSSAVFET